MFSLYYHTTQMPYLYCGMRKGIPTPFCQVVTRTYPILVTLHKLFYLQASNGKFVKVITWKIYPYLILSLLGHGRRLLEH
jgi:hypothetical protein